MRPISKLFLVVLIAVGGSTAAHAEVPTLQDDLDSQSLAIVTDLQLDKAFEKAMAKAGEQSLIQFNGPSSMLCENAAVSGEAETCVVTVPAQGQVVPAALAQR